MQLPKELYVHEADAKRIWEKFNLLDQRILFLQRNTTRMAMEFGEEDYPLRPFHFTLFPGSTNEEVNNRMAETMLRGRTAINTLLREHLDESQYDFFELPEIQDPFSFHAFIKDAYHNYHSTIKRNASARARYEAYAAIRAMELGYRVGTIDECPLVLNAVQHFPSVKITLENIFGFSHKMPTEKEGMENSWDTNLGIKIYSYDDTAMHTRVKYLEKDGYTPRYSSILMKIYKEGEFAEELKDYLGAELIVENDEERDCLVKFIKKETSLTGHLEKWKDTRKGKVGTASSKDYGVLKWILRVPVQVYRDIPQATKIAFYERVPIEIQVLTIKDHIIRTQQTETTHKAYKRRQFLEIFPALFPREIYENIY
ncbi:MAG: hypothetical protein Q8R18_05875 [bacterium]|nr:hypothetical protein [bacterium]